MARLSFAWPSFERCERPRTASVRAWRLQPGRLAQGPDEKCGLAGRRPGFIFVMWSTLPDRRLSLGRGVPLTGIRPRGGAVNQPMSRRSKLRAEAGAKGAQIRTNAADRSECNVFVFAP